MTVKNCPPGVTVTVHAGFDEDGRWVIEARLEIPWHLSRQERTRLKAEGRYPLTREIIREGLRGQALGARVMRLELVTDESIKVIQTLIRPDPDGGSSE